MGSWVLVIGGGRFIGRHIVAAAVARGHAVTTLNRGRTTNHGVEHVVCDRRNPTDEARRALTRDWDLVVDTCAYQPPDIGPTTAILRGRVRRYIMLSSSGVYARTRSRKPISERSPTVSPDDPRPSVRSALGKLACESLLGDEFSALLAPRLGLVTGPHDPTGRLTYWLERALRGGQMLVPMAPNQPVQLIDVRDVAAFVLDVAEKPVTGVINVVPPKDKIATARQLIDSVVAATGSRVAPRWLPERAVLDQDIQPWLEVPLWLPAHSPELSLMHVSGDRAADLGLTCRPLHETVLAIAQWYANHRCWMPQWLPIWRERTVLASRADPQ